MLFTQPIFGLFLAVVLVVYWGILRSQDRRKVLLLVASYVFYAAWDVRFLSLIVASTLIDFVAARRIEASSDASARRRWILVSLTANLGMLGVFKYFNFFADSLQDLLGSVGIGVSDVTLNITLPVGISFFTFQTLSYTIDVYRGKLRARERLLDLAVFVAFFPQLVAGPIVRAADFLPQLERDHKIEAVRWQPALMLFVAGFFKKAVLADTIGLEVDRLFANPDGFDGFSTVLGVLGYAAQIYCDFSGYSDMAIAIAAMLGYSLGENFDFPYFSPSIDVFWRRWHISLSSWLRDYLYIPLGGNRGGVRLTYRNLWLTMLLGGLWHGAAWTFVAWGALHGAALAVHKWWQGQRGPAASEASSGLAVVKIVATFFFVCCCWIFFRAGSFADAWTVLGNFVTLRGGGQEQISRWIAVYLLGGLALHWVAYRRVFTDRIAALEPNRFAMALGAVFALILTLRPLGSLPFIYFQF